MKKESREITKKKFTNNQKQEFYDDAKIAREFNKFIKVKLSEKQLELYKGMENAIITTIIGPAGSAKTFTACYAAIKALKKGDIKQIILMKPLETSGEEIGALPGNEREKTAPFMESFIDNLKEMVEGSDLKMMVDNGIIKFVPIAYLRGRTFKDTYIIADEMQNADIKQMITVATRFSENSRLVIIGDQRQNDINKKYVALDFFINEILGEDPAIFHFKFDRADIVRHPLIIKIIDNYENAIANGKIPETKNKN